MPHDHSALVLVDQISGDRVKRRTRSTITELIDASRTDPSRQDCDNEEALHRSDTLKERMDNQDAGLHPVKGIPVLGPVVA